MNKNTTMQRESS